MTKKIVVVSLVLICLLLTGQITAESKFKRQWQQIIIKKQKKINQQSEVKLQVKYELAVAYANLGNIKQADKLFQELEQKKWKPKIKKLITKYLAQFKNRPQDIKLSSYLGFAYYINTKYQAAEKLFKKIIKLDPRNIWCYNYLAVTQYEQQNYQQAQKTLEKSLAIAENQYTHFLLGTNYYKQGNLFKALYHIGKGKKAVNLFLDK